MTTSYVIPLTFTVNDVAKQFLDAGVSANIVHKCVHMWMARRLMDVCLLPSMYCRHTVSNLQIDRLLSEFIDYDQQLYKRIVTELSIGRVNLLHEIDFRFIDNTLLIWWLNEHAGIQSKTVGLHHTSIC